MDRVQTQWDNTEAAAIETIKGLIAKYRVNPKWHGKIGVEIDVEGARGPQRLSEVERQEHLIRN